MNIREYDVLRTLADFPCSNQRQVMRYTGYSLGTVNNSIQQLAAEGMLTDTLQLTETAKKLCAQCAPRNAVILAAGIGMRMVPINTLTPKALLFVQGETLIERIIKQLHEVNIRDITVVVGFMKERLEYLIDEYGVKLIVNTEYAEKNNLLSLSLAADCLSNTYIVPCDLWFAQNPFRKHELYSWYMVSDQMQMESEVRINRRMELVSATEKEYGNAMVGLSYVLEKDAAVLRCRLQQMRKNPLFIGAFWEAALYNHGKMNIGARLVSSKSYAEINTYEQLREIDDHSDDLKSDAMEVIANVLSCAQEEITEISVLKKGMTNRSFLFQVRGKKYIMRIPGEGTDQLINRKQETDVFRAISGLGLCDDPIYINPVNGYKITKYLDGVRVCDADDPDDLKKCMALLKQFHNMHLQVEHKFDIFQQIEFYEHLWDGIPSSYRDYTRTKANVLSLQAFIDNQQKNDCLTHIDAVPDNFLFYKPVGEKEERLQLTDWEYAGMQDPHVDIAMFCIYSLYDKHQIDRLIDIYFEGDCGLAVRAKIYCYIAACGLLWSNWTEYKRNLGVEFGEYGMRQYRYAKDYYRYAMEEINRAEAAQ